MRSSIFVLLALSPLLAQAADIGYVETFGLAGDRAKALEQLTPGTEDYYYYHCLHHQNTGNREAFARTMALWMERLGETDRSRVLSRRQTLLDYTINPRETLEKVKNELGIGFDHQRVDAAAEARIPSSWHPGGSDPASRVQGVLQQQGGLEEITDEGLPLLAGRTLSIEQQRQLLNRLTRPDFPGLVDLVLGELADRNSSGFGALAIHQRLTAEQLSELARRRPLLMREDRFVREVLARIRPADQIDLRTDRAQRRAYLERLLAFVRGLQPVHNSLRALVLYHALKDARAGGTYPHDLFREYLAVPRNVGYLSRRLRESASYNNQLAELGQEYDAQTGLPAIQNDEELVRDYLADILLDAPGLAGLDSFVDEHYLRTLQAQTRILAGDKEAEKYAAVLSPPEFQALRDRIDLDIAPTNPPYLAPADPVKLAVKVKNIKNLIVKAFEINPVNLYRETGLEVDQAIDLDGLVAAHEENLTLDAPPLRSVSRTFEFPWMQGRGIWVVELVGNGKSSRAVIRKGQLRLLEEASTAGTAFHVVDESGARVKDATVWMGKTEYAPDTDGRIVLPFAEAEGSTTVIIRQGAFASLARIQQHSERYALQVGFHVDREALIEGHKAKLLVRTSLKLAGRPVSLKLLKDVRLEIEATDFDGVATREDVPGFALEDDREAVHEFSVPERIGQLRFTLRARVDSMRDGKPVDLESSAALAVNAAQRTRATRDWFLRQSGGSYQLECRGRNGEPVPGRVVNVSLRHRAFRSEQSQTLRTDANGAVTLGDLAGVTHVTMSADQDANRAWELGGDAVLYPDHITVAAGEEITLPVLEVRDAALPQVSLIESIGARFAHDRSRSVKVEAGAARIAGLLPGRYDLLLRPMTRPITIEIGPGPLIADHVLTPREALHATPARFPSLASIAVEEKDLVVKVADATPDTRVHVFATWTRAPFSSFADLLPPGPADSVRIPLEAPESMYVSGRTVGDEYRYVLERRYAPKHAGVMLERPGLVLNPWALRDSASDVQEAAAGEAYGSRRQNLAEPSKEAAASPVAPGGQRSADPGLDFLGRPSSVLANLIPADGVVRIPRADLPPDVRVLVTGRSLHLERRIALEAAAVPTRDRRLAQNLPADRTFATTKLTSRLEKDKTLDIADRLSTRMRGFGNLREVYELLATLCPDPRLAEFRFAIDWPALSPDEKRARYSEFASHELNFFLRRKDPGFFRAVIRPHIANKHEKTFLDHWLLEDDLTRYLDPWPYARLNSVERILLARRTGHLDALRRGLEDRDRLSTRDPNQWNRLFAAALNTGSLGGDRGMAMAANSKSTEGSSGQKDMRQLTGPAGSAHDGPAGDDAPPPPPGAPAPGLAGAAAPEADGAPAEEAAGKPQMAENKKVEERREAEDDASLLLSMKRSSARTMSAPGRAGKLAMDLEARTHVRQLFRRVDKTKELVETHYYHRPIAEQNAGLVSSSDFWLDYARAADEDGFLSGRFPLAASNATEVMFVLAVLDLPFAAPPLASALDGSRLRVTAGGPAIVFHEEIKPTERATGKARVLVSQDFYPADARHRIADGEQVDNFVTDEFLPGKPYACDIVLSNPGSLPIDVDVLVQVPQGAIALDGAAQTRSLPVRIEPYNTYKPTFTFYFPTAGEFEHHPVEIAHRGAIIARADPFKFHVVDQLTNVDRTTWDEISQHGTPDEVIAFLKDRSLERLDLAKIAFRMRDAGFFSKTIETLRQRRIFEPTLWSYGVHHNDARAAREYLETTNLPTQVGPCLESPLLTVNPVERATYQHFDYDPLIHARAHPLGARRQIMNPQLAAEYHRFLDIVAHRSALADRDWLEAAYFLLLQDRVAEGLAAFDRVRADHVPSQVQYAYMHAVASLLRGDLAAARKAATPFASYTVPRWQGRFQEMLSQLGTPATTATTAAGQPTRDQLQDRLVATEPRLDLDIEAKVLRISHRLVPAVTVNYYKMDVELLFSRSPFVQDQTTRYSFVRPARTELVTTVPDQPVTKHLIPEALHTSDLMVEVVAGGLRTSRPYFASSLSVQVIEGYGQVQVANLDGITPRPLIYVKCFARMKDGSVRFYKDGYTDHRQRFDYASLSTDELEQVERFAILVLSEKLGAVVREASPPRK